MCRRTLISRCVKKSAPAFVSNPQTRAGSRARRGDRAGVARVASAHHDRPLPQCRTTIAAKLFKTECGLRRWNDSRRGFPSLFEQTDCRGANSHARTDGQLPQIGFALAASLPCGAVAAALIRLPLRLARLTETRLPGFTTLCSRAAQRCAQASTARLECQSMLQSPPRKSLMPPPPNIR